MRAVFIAGTGTDIGKTYVCAAAARQLKELSASVAYYKPAVSGADSVELSDAGYVRREAGLNQPDESLASYLYREPLSPHLAARLEGRFADLERIRADFNALKAAYAYCVCEGAGGAACPVVWEEGRRLTYPDIIRALGLKVLVVADAGLGTINHTVLTLSYLEREGIPVRGVILNRFEAALEQHRDNLKMIEELSGVRVAATLSARGRRLDLRGGTLESYFDEC